jgi:hypothetical protein
VRCEFKFRPESKNDFEDNGSFNIAVCWELHPSLNKQTLLRDLFSQNGCSDVIVMSEYQKFRNLEDYRVLTDADVQGLTVLANVMSWREPHTVYAAYIAAAIYPKKFEMGKMVETLCSRFEAIQRMSRRGRSNVVSALMQTSPPLIEHMHGRKFYRWKAIINPRLAMSDIGCLLTERFLIDPPGKEIVDDFHSAPQW